MSAGRRAARGLGLGPLVLFAAALACSSPSGGCSSDGGFWGDGGFWDFPPTPTPELIDAPDGGRLYLLLDGPAGPAIHVIQVGTNATASLLPLATVTSASSLAFDPVSGGFRVADSSRFGVALLDATGEEVGFLDTVARPVDVEYAPLLQRTFVATTEGLLIFDAENALIDGLRPPDSISTAVSIRERETVYEDDDCGYPRTLVETYVALSTITEAGGTVYDAWWESLPGDDVENVFAESHGSTDLADSLCVPRPDDVLVSGFESPPFVGDSECDRIFLHGSSANLGAAASGSKPTANRLAWSAERGVLLAAEADSLFALDPVTRSVETIPGFARATVVAGSIGGRNIWVGSAALDSASQPVLHRWAVGPPVDMPAGPAGTSVVDIDYVDRPPRFQNLGWGGIGVVTKRGRLGYYRVEAVDDDGDVLVIAVPDPVVGLRFDDDTHAFTWRIPCDEEATYLTVRITATAGRYRSPIDFTLFIDEDEPGDPCAE